MSRPTLRYPILRKRLVRVKASRPSVGASRPWLAPAAPASGSHLSERRPGTAPEPIGRGVSGRLQVRNSARWWRAQHLESFL